MSDLPTATTLKAAMCQLNAKWRGKNGVEQCRVQVDGQGLPFLVLEGPSPSPQPGLPGVMVVPATSGRPFRVPVLWRQAVPAVGFDAGYLAVGPQAPLPGMGVRHVAPEPPVAAPTAHVELYNPNGQRPLDPVSNEDIDRAYWWFFVNTQPRDVKEYYPAFNMPQVPTAIATPAPDAINPQIQLDTRLPQYDAPNFWAKPFEPFGAICTPYYQRPVIALSYRIPETYLAVIDSISLDTQYVFAQGEVIQIDLLQDGSTLLSFEEYAADPANADPAHKFLFTGSGLKPNMWARFDRNSLLTVQLTFKGQFPFVKTAQDTFCATVSVLLHGWLGSLMDNRDGTARPIDVGGMRDYQGDEVLFDRWVIDDLPERMRVLQGWLAQATNYVR